MVAIAWRGAGSPAQVSPVELGGGIEVVAVDDRRPGPVVLDVSRSSVAKRHHGRPEALRASRRLAMSSRLQRRYLRVGLRRSRGRCGSEQVEVVERTNDPR